MKKIILLFIAVAFSGAAQAQLQKYTDDALDKHVLAVALNGAEMASLELLTELELTAEQYEQVALLNTERYKKLEEAEQQYKDDALMRSKVFYSINLEADKQLSVLLAPNQLIRFVELEHGRQPHLVSDNADE